MAVNATSDAWTISGQTATDWLRRRTIGLLGTKIGSTLTDFPVLVKVPTATWGGNVQADGDDVAFVQADGTVLDFEIEAFDASGDSWFHVRQPTFTTGIGTEYFWMYYHNAGLGASLANATGVWDAWLFARYGLSDASGTLQDSIANYPSTSETALTYGATGQIANAIDLNSTTSNADVGFMTQIDNATELYWSGWLFLDSAGIGAVFTKSVGNTNRLFFFLLSGNLRFYFANGADQHARVSIPTSAWVHVAVSYDGAGSGNTGKLKVYFDGVLQTLLFSGTVPSSLGDLSGVSADIGKGGGFDSMNGKVDEMRIGTSTRSADWIAAEYLSGLDGLTTLGEEQSQAVGGLLRHPGMTGRMQELRGGVVA